MQVLNCKPKNIKACAELFVQVYSESDYQENWTTHEAFKYLERFYLIEPSRCFVAVENDKVVGSIFAYSYPWRSETLVYIQELFVDSNQRQKGIAKTLLSSTGCGIPAKAWLIANENTGAAKFYAKMGFKKNGPYKFQYGEINT
ncbi:MAG: GNAT family N-acetyltransferase [Reichenbachiella sp.]